MRSSFLLTHIFKSLFRNKINSLLIILNLTFSLVVLSIIFSLLNANYQDWTKTIWNGENIKVLYLSNSMPLEKALDLEDSLKADKLITGFSTLAVTRMPVKYNGITELQAVFGTDMDDAIMFNWDIANFNQNSSVISESLANKWYGSTEKAIGESVYINDEAFIITGIDDASSNDRIYISYDKLLQLESNIDVNSINVDFADEDSFNKFKASNLGSQINWIEDYNTIKSNELVGVRIFILLGSLLGILLLSFSILSIVYLYTYKMLEDQEKWRIIFLMGAKRNDLKLALIFEATIYSIVALLLSLAMYKLITPIVTSRFIALENNYITYLSLAILIVLSIYSIVYFSYRKLNKENYFSLEVKM